MITLFRTLPFIVAALFANAASAAPESINNLDKKGLALQGYDPVGYFQGEAVKGSGSWETKHGGARYRFSSQENLTAFQASPERYLPEYGGWCAFAMLDGEKVGVNPKSFKIVEEKLYLFYDGLWGDTLKQWNKRLNEQDESALIAKADGHWETLSAMPASSE